MQQFDLNYYGRLGHDQVSNYYFQNATLLSPVNWGAVYNESNHDP